MRCIYCGTYFKRSVFNSSNECDACYSVGIEETLDDETRLQMDILKNPSGKTPPIFYDETYGHTTE